jgi:hypothetical protein
MFVCTNLHPVICKGIPVLRDFRADFVIHPSDVNIANNQQNGFENKKNILT